MSMSAERRERTYGNWRRPRSAGLGQLGMIGTGGLMGGMIVVVLVIAFTGLVAGVVTLVVLAVVLSSLLVKDRHGKSGLQLIGTRVGWWRTRSRGSHLYRSGPLGRTQWGSYQLPGVLAQSRLSEARDAYDRPFAVIETPAVGHFSVVLASEPDGASLVDQDQIDQWVARWGEFLRSIADEPGLLGVSVTVETAPDTGTRLRREVSARIDPDAHHLARRVLHEVVESYPVGSAQINAWIALTFAAHGRGRRRRSEEFARELATRLPGITQRLHGTGAGAPQPVAAQQLCELVRGAYDPAASRIIEEAYAAGQVPRLRWPDVGPAAAEASWGSYRHDGAISVSWAMSSAPRGEVHSNVLSKLMAPHRDIARKRVTMLYRVLDAGVAGRIVEMDKRTSDFRVRSSQRPSERNLREQSSAIATAQEEARGAGLVDFGMLVTATVEDELKLAEAEAAIDNLAATARITLRRVWGSQDSAFTATLPVGVLLGRHLRVPAGVRNAL
jgi:hypothetical protein